MATSDAQAFPHDPDLPIARIRASLELLEKLPCRSELKRALVVFCTEFLQIIPSLPVLRQDDIARGVAFIVVDAIIEQPEVSWFRLDIAEWLSGLVKSGVIGAEAAERIRRWPVFQINRPVSD